MELRLQLEDAKAQEEVFQIFYESKKSLWKWNDKQAEIEHKGMCVNVSKNEAKPERNLHERSSSHYATIQQRPNSELMRQMHLPTLQLQSFYGDLTQYL